jgi:hypothetical protein
VDVARLVLPGTAEDPVDRFPATLGWGGADRGRNGQEQERGDEKRTFHFGTSMVKSGAFFWKDR